MTMATETVANELEKHRGGAGLIWHYL